MNTTDFIASFALAISAATLGLQLRQWFDSRPRLHLSIIADAVEIPAGDGKPKLALTVTNRGNEPTQITHMIAFTFPNRWRRWRRRPETTGIVNTANIPSMLKPKEYWMGFMVYNPKITAAREAGQLYVGIIATHRRREYLMVVPQSSLDKAQARE